MRLTDRILLLDVRVCSPDGFKPQSIDYEKPGTLDVSNVADKINVRVTLPQTSTAGEVGVFLSHWCEQTRSSVLSTVTIVCCSLYV